MSVCLSVIIVDIDDFQLLLCIKKIINKSVCYYIKFVHLRKKNT